MTFNLWHTNPSRSVNDVGVVEWLLEKGGGECEVIWTRSRSKLVLQLPVVSIILIEKWAYVKNRMVLFWPLPSGLISADMIKGAWLDTL